MRFILTPVLIFLLLVSATAEEPQEPPGGDAQPPMDPAAVEVATVVQQTVAGGRTFVGTVEPTRRSLVGSEFGGLVTAVLARQGDRVEATQPLASLRTEILALRLEAARAQLESVRHRVAELENGSRPEEIQQARARVDQLQADLELRRWKLAASKQLFEQKTISEDELRDAQLADRASELLLDAAKSALALVEAGPRDEQIAQARADMQRQAAEVSRLEEEKRRYTIQAPFDGWIVSERTEVGQWISPGSPIAEILALDEVDVTIQVVEDYVGRLAEGMPVRVSVDAVPGRIFTGTIHRIVPSADLRGRTFPVKVRLPNERVGKSVLLKAGMFASATLAVEDPRPALMVPKDAIVIGGIAPLLVWVVDPETSTAKLAPVQLGVAQGELIQVLGPLQPGDQVVVRGNERIMFPGQPLKIVER